jgi:hypothetical protein|tara:strand:+ start:4574 stop:4804 length:231 start_codon:yes stop_codon:yes gene_type:complete
MRNVLIIQKEEMEQCKVWNLDPDFLALFEETDEIKPTSPPKIPVPDVKPGYDLLDTTPQNEYGLDGEHIDVEDPHG